MPRRKPSKISSLAKGKRTPIATLAKSVKSIQRRMKKDHIYLNYGVTYNQSVSGDVTVFPLSLVNGWNQIFGTTANDGTFNKIQHTSFGMDMYLSLENTINEPDTIGFTLFLVSLKDDIGQNFNPATGVLGLAPNFHYTTVGGMVLLNKKVFNIHKVKRCTLTNHGTALSAPSAQSQGGTDWRGYWKCSVRKSIVNPYGDWRALPCPPDPSTNYYLLAFNDDSSLDLQSPNIKINVVHTVKTQV